MQQGILIYTTCDAKLGCVPLQDALKSPELLIYYLSNSVNRLIGII